MPDGPESSSALARMRWRRSSSENAIFFVDFRQQAPLMELFAGAAFSRRIVVRFREPLVRNRLRNDHDAVDVAEHGIPRADAYTGADDRTIHLDHSAAALAVEWSDAAVEYGKFHPADLPDVAHHALGHAAGGAARLCCCRQQFAPRRDAVGRTAAREDGHVAGLEVVHQPDLEFVGVLAFEH